MSNVVFPLSGRCFSQYIWGPEHITWKNPYLHRRQAHTYSVGLSECCVPAWIPWAYILPTGNRVSCNDFGSESRLGLPSQTLISILLFSVVLGRPVQQSIKAEVPRWYGMVWYIQRIPWSFDLLSQHLFYKIDSLDSRDITWDLLSVN